MSEYERGYRAGVEAALLVLQSNTVTEAAMPFIDSFVNKIRALSPPPPVEEGCPEWCMKCHGKGCSPTPSPEAPAKPRPANWLDKRWASPEFRAAYGKASGEMAKWDEGYREGIEAAARAEVGFLEAEKVELRSERDDWMARALAAERVRDEALAALREVVDAIEVLAERAALIGWIDKDQQVEVRIDRARRVLAPRGQP